MKIQSEKQEILKQVEIFATNLNSVLPQISEEKLNYYISGSMAMFILSIAKSIEIKTFDCDGKEIFKGSKIELIDKQKESLLNGVRMLGKDIDVVYTNDCVTELTPFRLAQTACDFEKCFSKLPGSAVINNKILKTPSADALAETHNINQHNVVVAVFENGQEVIISNPVDLLLHKINELLNIIHKGFDDEKCKKDISDFVCLFNTVCQMGIMPKDIAGYIENLIVNGNEFSKSKKVDDNMFLDNIKLVYDYLLVIVDEENREQLKTFMFKLNTIRDATKDTITLL